MPWLTSPDAWDGSGAAAWALPEIGDEPTRRLRLRELAARALGVEADAVRIAHRDGLPPRLVAPAGRGLHLSSASRGGWVALAVAPGPVGVDIEAVEDRAEIPYGVLHPDEAADLRGRPGGERPRAFARLWTVKEAYLKALGTGLSRDPASFRVIMIDPRAACVADPVITGLEARAETRWFSARVVSLVRLPPLTP